MNIELWRDWLWPGVAMAIAVTVALFTHWLAFTLLGRLLSRGGHPTDDAVLRRSRRPACLILPVLAGMLVLSDDRFPQAWTATADHVLALGLIASIAWLLVSLMSVFEDFVTTRSRLAKDNSDSPEARRLRTQALLFRRTGVVLVVIITLSGMLMTFPSVRHVGVSLFASAGIAGLVAGIAARPMLSNLIAGMQLALTDVVSIGDVVVVEGQWGRIEEITTTNIVMRIWDLRSLVLPLSYFIEKPFENWTKTGSALMGTVMVYADYSVPVEAVRDELKKLLDSSHLWDRHSWSLQVTGTSERTVELRALMSAADSGALWDLRCLVREQLVAFLQAHHPQALPKTRAEVVRTA
jgi:small-conductance mechanosensitive channel